MRTVYKGKLTLSKGILPCPKENQVCPKGMHVVWPVLVWAFSVWHRVWHAFVAHDCVDDGAHGAFNMWVQNMHIDDGKDGVVQRKNKVCPKENSVVQRNFKMECVQRKIREYKGNAWFIIITGYYFHLVFLLKMKMHTVYKGNHHCPKEFYCEQRKSVLLSRKLNTEQKPNSFSLWFLFFLP